MRKAIEQMKHSGRSMVEMLGVLAIIGILSVGAYAGFQSAMNKHKANTIAHDAVLLATHVLMSQTTVLPSDFYADSGKTFTIALKANGFIIQAPDVGEKVCRKMMDMVNPPIEHIYAGTDGNTTCSDTQTMLVYFVTDDSISSGSGLPPPVDPCEGVICENGGSCDKGTCVCVNGFTGVACEIEPDPCADFVATTCQTACVNTGGVATYTNANSGVACTTDEGENGKCDGKGVCVGSCYVPPQGLDNSWMPYVQAGQARCPAGTFCEYGSDSVDSPGGGECAVGPVPENLGVFGGKHFFHSNTGLSWWGAGAWCIANGGRMATYADLVFAGGCTYPTAQEAYDSDINSPYCSGESKPLLNTASYHWIDERVGTTEYVFSMYHNSGTVGKDARRVYRYRPLCVYN